MTVDAFVGSLRESLMDSGGDSIEEVVDRMGAPDLVRERLLHYVERAS
jgi:hypothetical protein